MASIVDYKGLDIVTPDPTGAAGLMLNNDLKTIADTLEALAAGTGITDGVLTLAKLATAVQSLINGSITAKVTGDTLSFGTNNSVTGAAAAVNLPIITAADVGKKLTVTFTGTVSLTINAQGIEVISDSAAGGNVADVTAAESGWANITLQAILATAGAVSGRWIILGGDGTWVTT